MPIAQENIPSPLVSVIIVCQNSAAYLSHCLESLCAQTIADFEVVLIDNCSSDDAVEELHGKWTRLNFQIERLGENKGFAAPNNIGARLARGKWLVLLNADVFPEVDWLEQLLKAARDNPESTSFSSRQIQSSYLGVLQNCLIAVGQF